MTKSKILLSLLLGTGIALTGCSNSADTEKKDETVEKTDDTAKTEDASAKSEGVMTYKEYVDAPLDSEVTVEAYVQAKQSWWEDNGQGKATLYTQDPDGAYFVYNANMSEEDYNKLVHGQKVKITGYKSEWSGETEITDATVEIEDGNWIAPLTDVTDILASDELIDHQNQHVTFKDMTVEEIGENGETFLYNYDGSGDEGDDLYFKVSKDGNDYTFTVESYLTGADTDVYKQVKKLKAGDTVDMEGYLYWYEGANPHITVVTVK